MSGFVVFCAVLAAHTITPAQSDISDADLIAASGARTVRLGATSDGHVTVLPLEVYVSRVLAGEADPRSAEAAQQALAIAVRTYTLKNIDRHLRDGYDLCDSTHCQVPRPSTPMSRRAALATAGQVLTYRGALASVFYSASCGGRSERARDVWPGADYPYLVSREDEVCEDDPSWTVTFRFDDIRRALAAAGFDGDRLTDIAVESRTSSGRVARLHLSGLRPDVIAGDQFRLAIGAVVLRSTAFDLQRDGDGIRLTGRGFGHGVGMCVIGAGRRASRGESARAILAQYYPGLDLESLGRVAVPTEIVSATPPRTTSEPAANTPVVPARAPGVSAAVPQVSNINAPDLERLTARVRDDLARTLRVGVPPVTIRLHDTLDSFRLATNRPWWVSEVAAGTAIDLAPAAVLAQRGGLESVVRVAVAELLVADTFAGRPAWVRTGAARYFSRAVPIPPASDSVRCPADAELTLAVSAPAQGEAEARAEACFARALERTGDWRTVR